MPTENEGEGRTEPVRITHTTIAPGDPRGMEEGPLVIRATLDPGARGARLPLLAVARGGERRSNGPFEGGF